MTSEKFFFNFRQVIPKPPGSWVVCGPFDTYGQARADLERNRAWDAELGDIYVAPSLKEAEERLKNPSI